MSTPIDPATLPEARYRAIRTRYVGPTNNRGSRVIADAGDRASRLTLEWDDRLNAEQNHAAAAVALTQKMGWVGEYYTPLVGGAFPDHYVWVFMPHPEMHK